MPSVHDLVAATRMFEQTLVEHFDQFGAWTSTRPGRVATVVWSVPTFAPRMVLADAAGGLAVWQPSILPGRGVRVGQTFTLMTYRLQAAADAFVHVGDRQLWLPKLTHVVWSDEPVGV